MLFNAAAILASAALVFVYVRRRLGAWAGIFAACLLLFLGSAWQDLLWPFEMGFTVGLAAGIGILLALERDDQRGDLIAAVLLLIAIGYGSFGLSFGFAVFVDICLKHRRRGWGRLWIVALPLVLYLGWYAGWGHEAEHHLTFQNILDSPVYVFEGLASAVGSVTGLDAGDHHRTCPTRSGGGRWRSAWSASRSGGSAAGRGSTPASGRCSRRCSATGCSPPSTSSPAAKRGRAATSSPPSGSSSWSSPRSPAATARASARSGSARR